MSTRIMWRIFGIAGFLFTVLLVTGFYLGVKGVSYSGPVASPGNAIPEAGEIGSKNKILIVSLGDSLTRGTGDETGKGYVGNLQDELRKSSKRQVFDYNLGIYGYRAENLLSDLQHRQDIRASVKEAEIITLSIGANDLFHANEEEVDPAVISKRIPTAMGAFQKIVHDITAINPKATLLYMGLYNPFGDLPNAKQSNAVVQAWNNQAAHVLNQYHAAVMVPTADIFQLDVKKYLSSDHYHPNAEGYRRIGLRMAQALE